MTAPSTPSSSYCPTPELSSELGVKKARSVTLSELPSDLKSSEDIFNTAEKKLPRVLVHPHKKHHSFAVPGKSGWDFDS